MGVTDTGPESRAPYYPKQTATDAYNTAFPIPKAEFDARKGNITPVCN